MIDSRIAVRTPTTYGTDELPAAWPAVRERLIAAVERALAQLDA
jgi:hypothetical protein